MPEQRLRQGRISYAKQWEAFYAEHTGTDAEPALWDVGPEQAVARDYALFSDHFLTDLAVIYFGCGTGRQTSWLGGMYPLATGLDVSSRAISAAQSQFGNATTRFRVLDEPNYLAAGELHDETGDSNIYIRGVLHQVKPEDRGPILRALRRLAGERGRIFIIEVGDGIKQFLTNESGLFTRLPVPMQKTLISRLPPRGLSLAQLPQLFPSDQFRLISSGSSTLDTNLACEPGQRFGIPAVYGILEPTG